MHHALLGLSGPHSSAMPTLMSSTLPSTPACPSHSFARTDCHYSARLCSPVLLRRCPSALARRPPFRAIWGPKPRGVRAGGTAPGGATDSGEPGPGAPGAAAGPAPTLTGRGPGPPSAAVVVGGSGSAALLGGGPAACGRHPHALHRQPARGVLPPRGLTCVPPCALAPAQNHKAIKPEPRWAPSLCPSVAAGGPRACHVSPGLLPRTRCPFWHLVWLGCFVRLVPLESEGFRAGCCGGAQTSSVRSLGSRRCGWCTRMCGG